MKITGVKPLACFSFIMDDGSKWFRLFTPTSNDPDSMYIWLECRGNDALEVSAEKSDEVEKVFLEWVEVEKTRAIEELKQRGYKVIAVDSVEQLQEMLAAAGEDKKTVH